MIKIGEYKEVAKCNHCDKIIGEYKFNNFFFTPVCPYCGEENDFEKVVAKEEFLGKWYLPWTWLKFDWVEK